MHVDAKITSKNQITLPREVRKRLGVAPGGRVRFEVADDGTVSVRKQNLTMADLRGIINIGRPVSTEEIVAMVREGRDGRAEHHVRILAEDVTRRRKAAE